MSCDGSGPPIPPKNGYPPGTPVVVPTAFPGVDWTLRPFDKMGQATAITTGWVEVVGYNALAGNYCQLLYIGQDCNDPTAYQRVSWRVTLNQGGVGGDENGLIPALEARCGILDGTMMPFRLFIPQGARVAIWAMLTAPAGEEESTVVRARLQGETRMNQGGGSI